MEKYLEESLSNVRTSIKGSLVALLVAVVNLSIQLIFNSDIAWVLGLAIIIVIIDIGLVISASLDYLECIRMINSLKE